jgi:hypothetical protein
MSGDTKGWVGSLAVHAGILAVLVGASWYASRQTGENLEAVDPLIVTLDGIPGKKPGQIGKAPGVAQGDERGVAGGMVEFTVRVNGVTMYNQRADGLILAKIGRASCRERV